MVFADLAIGHVEYYKLSEVTGMMVLTLVSTLPCITTLCERIKARFGGFVSWFSIFCSEKPLAEQGGSRFPTLGAAKLYNEQHATSNWIG